MHFYFEHLFDIHSSPLFHISLLQCNLFCFSYCGFWLEIYHSSFHNPLFCSFHNLLFQAEALSLHLLFRFCNKPPYFTLISIALSVFPPWLDGTFPHFSHFKLYRYCLLYNLFLLSWSRFSISRFLILSENEFPFISFYFCSILTISFTYLLSLALLVILEIFRHLPMTIMLTILRLMCMAYFLGRLFSSIGKSRPPDKVSKLSYRWSIKNGIGICQISLFF